MENRIYMSEYMKKKYAENTDAIKSRNKKSYELNKHSCLKQKRRLKKCIDKLYNEVVLLINHNEECEDVLDYVVDELETLIPLLKWDQETEINLK